MINTPSEEDVEAFMGAAMIGDMLTLKNFLGKFPSSINAKGRGGHTALMQAAYYRQKDAVSFLLENGADPNAEHHLRGTALIMAAKFGYEDIAAMLLEKGAEIDLRDSWGDSPVRAAKEGGHKGILRLLEEWPEKLEKRLAAERAAQDLAADIADFSPGLKRNMPAPRPPILRKIKIG